MVEQYTPGQEVLYVEDGGVCVARVLENNCTEEEISYTLKVSSCLIPHPLGPCLREGNEFVFSKVIGVGDLGALVGDIKGSLEDPKIKKAAERLQTARFGNLN